MRCPQRRAAIRVARWYIFKPKIQLWENFGGPWNGKGWCTLWPFGIYYGHLVIFVLIWFIFPCFGILCKEKSGNPGHHAPGQEIIVSVLASIFLRCICTYTDNVKRGNSPIKTYLGGIRNPNLKSLFKLQWQLC
jgi:hypothetical protein